MHASTPKPWWIRHEITIKFDGGQLRVRCAGWSVAPPGRPHDPPINRWFGMVTSPTIDDLARGEKAAEVFVYGERYRVYRYEKRPDDKLEQIRLHCEPIGVGVAVDENSKRPIQEQILDELRSEPEGMTARQISDKLECTRQWVFSALNSLLKSQQVTKSGIVYRVCPVKRLDS
jgi:hypothetical protein